MSFLDSGGLDPFSSDVMGGSAGFDTSGLFDPSSMGFFGGGDPTSLSNLAALSSGFSGVDPSTGLPLGGPQVAQDPGNQLGPDQTGGGTPTPVSSDQPAAGGAAQQQGGLLQYLRSLNPVQPANAGPVWTPGGGATPTENINQRFPTAAEQMPQVTMPRDPISQGELQGGGFPGATPVRATPVSGVAPAVQPPVQTADPATGLPTTGTIGAMTAVPVEPGGLPPASTEAPVSTGYTSPTTDPAAQPEEPGQAPSPGAPQRPQQQPGLPGGLAGLLRQIGLPGPLASLAAQAIMQGLYGGRGGFRGFPGRFPGQFPFRGGFPGRGGGFPDRFGRRGAPFMRPGMRGAPMMSRGSPLPRYQAPNVGAGAQPYVDPNTGQVLDPTQPLNNLDVPDPRADLDAERAGARETDPLADTESRLRNEAAPGAPATTSTATPAGTSRTGVPLSRITVPGSNAALTVASDAAPAFSGFLNDLRAAGAPLSDVGGYNYRNIAGTNRLSQHAFGRAIDVDQRGRNAVSPAFRQWANNNRQLLAQLTQKWGLTSGGDWRNPDFGHWEYRRRHFAANNPAVAFAHGWGD